MTSAARGEKPFDFANTPGKLPKDVVPTDYAIRIVPDVAKMRFAGTESIRLDVKNDVRELVFNALEIEITSAAVDDNPLTKASI